MCLYSFYCSQRFLDLLAGLVGVCPREGTGRGNGRDRKEKGWEQKEESVGAKTRESGKLRPTG